MFIGRRRSKDFALRKECHVYAGNDNHFPLRQECDVYSRRRSKRFRTPLGVPCF